VLSSSFGLMTVAAIGMLGVSFFGCRPPIGIGPKMCYVDPQIEKPTGGTDG
jgi:hypothetical protein